MNSKIPIEVEDPTFTIYPATYPLSETPDELKRTLASVLQDAGKANVQLFFDGTLTALANDLSRGLYCLIVTKVELILKSSLVFYSRLIKKT